MPFTEQKASIRYEMIKHDRILYGKRRDNCFYIPKEKILNPDCDFSVFRECLIDVKGNSED